MNGLARPALIALALSAALTAGCGSAAGSGPGPSAEAPPGGTPFLATSVVTSAGTWAVAVMGGSVATHNNFWQLFERPAGSAGWKLVTPPGVPDNGGLVIAGAAGRSLITAFRPSQYLTYTPLTVTRDDGQAWSPAGPLDAALADTPDALAMAPGTGRLLALLTSGTVKLAAAPGYTRWSTLASQRALAATPAGRRCGLTSLTAATFTPSGLPLLAGKCSRPGTAGIFARNGTWQAAGPALPATLGHLDIAVLRLTQTAHGTVALLQAGAGPTASLLAAWSASNGGQWALSPPLRLHGAKLASASFGPNGATALVLSGNRAQTIAGAGAAWRPLPALPAGTATLAPGPSGGFDALAVHRTRLTVWQLGPGTAAWHAIQAMNVPVQFGSSG